MRRYEHVRIEAGISMTGYPQNGSLTKAGLLEWFFIPVRVPLPIEALFRDDVDTKEPYDRTLTAAARG
jgi:hypothetical protein